VLQALVPVWQMGWGDLLGVPVLECLGLHIPVRALVVAPFGLQVLQKDFGELGHQQRLIVAVGLLQVFVAQLVQD
jgi:hypothetical protein